MAGVALVRPTNVPHFLDQRRHVDPSQNLAELQVVNRPNKGNQRRVESSSFEEH